MAHLQFLSTVILLLGIFLRFSKADDITCLFTERTVQDLMACFDLHTVGEDSYNAASYTTAQPTSSEISAWNTAVSRMLDFPCRFGSGGSVTSVDVPGLQGDYTITGFREISASGTPGIGWYCVLSEVHTISTGNMAFKRGWGTVIVPAVVAGVLRDVHFSVPHPGKGDFADGATPKQAGALFAMTGARSLVVSGRNRKAYGIATSCSEASGNDVNYITDGAHDNTQPFHMALVRVFNWQTLHGGCPRTTCAYLQLHGNKSCGILFAFLSSGRGNSKSSEECYADVNLPARRLKTELSRTIPSLSIGMPTETPVCDLTATRNIFGRLVSGIDPTDVCVNSRVIDRDIRCGKECTTATSCMGSFVHIEQNEEARLERNYLNWADAITAVF